MLFNTLPFACAHPISMIDYNVCFSFNCETNNQRETRMKIAIVGTGAMGSLYAALLGDAGNEVWAIDQWKEHVDAIQHKGLRLEGKSGDRTVPIHAATSTDSVGPCDLVIIATKAMHVAAAAESSKPLMGPETIGGALKGRSTHLQLNLEHRFKEYRLLNKKLQICGASPKY